MGEAGLKPPAPAKHALPLYSICSSLREVRSRPAEAPAPGHPVSQQRPSKPRGRAVRPLLRFPSPRVQPPKRSGWRRARAQTDGSPDARFRSLEVIPSPGERPAVPEGNASRVLPRALRKTPPASAADMASEFPASPEYPGWEAAARHGTAQPNHRARGAPLGAAPFAQCGAGGRLRGAPPLGAPLVLPERGGSVSGPSGIDWGAWRVGAPRLRPACMRRGGAPGLWLEAVGPGMGEGKGSFLCLNIARFRK